MNKIHKFQIVDYYDHDQTNEELGEQYEKNDVKPNGSPPNYSVLSWWNFVKPLWLHRRKSNYILYLFGRTNEGKSISVQVKDFQPYLYVKLPEEWTEKSKPFKKFKEWFLRELWLNMRGTPKKIKKTRSNNMYHGCANNVLTCNGCLKKCRDTAIEKFKFYINKKAICINKITKYELMKGLSYSGYELETEVIDKIHIKLIGLSDEIDNNTMRKIVRNLLREHSVKNNKLTINSYQQLFTAKRCPDRWFYFYKTMEKEELIDEMYNYLGINVEELGIRYRKVLKEFTNDKDFPFLHIKCHSKSTFNHVKKIFQENASIGGWDRVPRKVTIQDCVQDHIFDLYEADINPICRFTDHTNVKGSGWVQIDNYNMAIKTDSNKFQTKCKYDIKTNWKNIKALEKDGLAKMVMAFYDIECDSSHGDFPQANKTYTMTVREILTEYQRLYKIRNFQNKIKQKKNEAKANGEKCKLTEQEERVNKIKRNQIPGKTNSRQWTIKFLTQAMIHDNVDIIDNIVSENNISKVFYKTASNLSVKDEELNDSEKWMPNDKRTRLSKFINKVKDLLSEIKNMKDIKVYFENINKLYKLRIKYDENEIVSSTKVNDGGYTYVSHVQDRLEEELEDEKKKSSKKMRDYIDHNMEKYKIMAFNKFKTEIIGKCATYINSNLICEDYTNDTESSKTELSAKKQATLNKCQEILDKYLPPIKGDPIIQIGTCLQRQGEPESYKKHILTLGTCDDIPGVEVVRCETEDELIMKWKQLLEDEDVDCLLGWNNYDFDYPYIWDRAEATGVLREYRTLGRFKYKDSIKKEKRLSSSALGDSIWYDIDNVGRVQIDLMRVVRDDVTINLDRYTLDHVSSVFMRGAIKDCIYNEDEDYTTILTNSTTGLHAESYIKISYIKCHTEDYYGDSAKLQISEILEDGSGFKIKGKIDLNAKEHKYSWSMSKDDVSPQDIFRKQKEGPAERCIIAKYCVKDVVLCVELCQKLTVIVNKTGMSNVCCVPFLWIFTRGQTAKTYSLFSKECRSLDYVLPTLYRPDNTSYAGAVVLKPTPGIYLKKPVAVLDFGSLYPSIIINCNMSHETLVKDPYYQGEEGGQRLKDMGLDYKDIPIYVWEMKDGVNQEDISATHRFIQPKLEEEKQPDGSYSKPESRGIVPRILMKLLSARKSTRGQAKYKTVTLKSGDEFIGAYSKDKDGVIGTVKTHKGDKNTFNVEDVVTCVDTYTDFEKEIFNGLQLAYKVSANSVYGLLGATVSPIYCPEIAASTTAEGRRLLEFSGNYARDNYKNKPFTYTDLNGEKQDILIESTDVVYGDTDSIFVLYNIKDKDGNYIYNREAVKASIDISLDVEVNITPIFGYPHVLEYEKTFWPFVLISKKRYAGDKYEFNPHKAKQTSMGLVTKRRDNAKIVKYIFGGILDIIMGQKDLQAAINFLQDNVRNIMQGKFHFDKFIITKKLRAFYKNPRSIAHKVLADRMGERDPGNKPKSNERLPYAYIEVPGNKKKMLQGDRIEHPSFIKENLLNLDYEHYITNQVSKPVSQIFGLELENLDKKYEYTLDKDYYQNRYKHWYDNYKTKGKQFPEVLAEKKIREERTKMAQTLLIEPIIHGIKNNKKIKSEAQSEE